MAESLRRLANSGAYGALQDRLDSWQDDFHLNTCNENLSRCCELIEMTSKVQNQLFNIMSSTANRGGPTAGAETIKSRFLPWLSSSFTVSPCVSPDTSLTLIREAAEKERQLQDLSTRHMREVGSLESELQSTHQALSNAKHRLQETTYDLEDAKTKSATTLLASEEEILQLRADLQAAREEAELNRREREDSERQARYLQAEMATLQQEKARLLERMSYVQRAASIALPLLSLSGSSRSAPTVGHVHSTITEWTKTVKHDDDCHAQKRPKRNTMRRNKLVQRLQMSSRVLTQATKKKCNEMKFTQKRNSICSELENTHTGPESMEEAVLDYIVNLDLYDVQSSVADVIRELHADPRISFPPEVEFALLAGFVRELCRVAFEMQALEPTLDVALAVEGELYNERK
uniref:Mitochondria-eating protein n=1 Tax=Petromyzon marinus TaxID=7757 RepID=S4RLZ9_PETMA